MEHFKFICDTCKHYRPIEGGCAAFPEGIPQEIIDSNKHDKPIKGQGNKLVYEKQVT